MQLYIKRRVARHFLSLATILITSTVLTSPSAASQEESESLVLVDGDVMLAAMLRTNFLQDGQCGQYDTRSLQEIMAITWFLDRVNAMDYIPNITIGLEVYRTCKLPTLANKGMVTLLNKYRVGADNSAADNSTLLLGIVGPDRTAEATAVSQLIGALPANQRVLQISGSATGRQLSDERNTLYPNFFRVIPCDEIQIQVMVDLIVQLQWNYMAVVYVDDDYGRSGATELRSLLEKRQVCVPVFASLPLDTGSFEFNTKKRAIAGQITENGLILGMVILGGQSTTQQLLLVLQNQAKFVQLIFSEAVGLRTSTFFSLGTQSVSIGSLLTAPLIITLPEFAPEWNKLWKNQTHFKIIAEKNAWLKEYYVQITKCDFADEDCWLEKLSARNEQTVSEGESTESEFSFYLGYQVKAAAVMASLLKRLHDNHCGSSFPGICPQLRNAIVQRKPVQDLLQGSSFPLSDFASVSATFADNFTVSFTNTGDVMNVDGDDGYNVYNLCKTGEGEEFRFQRVGTFSAGNLTINRSKTEFYDETGSPLTWEQLPPAQCENGRDCLNCERDITNDVIFIEGDFYLVAILPVHAKNTEDLLQCGKIKGLTGADLAQSVIFAVKNVNNRSNTEFSNILPNRTVGLIGMTSCGSQLLVKQRLMDLFSGRLPLPDTADGRPRTSSVLLPYVMGVVGAFYSSNSIAASDVLSNLDRTLVQVSAASTSTDLKDRVRHPYFMRLVPADDKQAQVLLDIVASLGANYIQVIYDKSTAYATGLFQKLQEAATNTNTNKRYNICIAQSIGTTPHKDVSQYIYIVDKLRAKSAAKIVIVILHAEEVNKTMEAILSELRNDGFLFLASESWGRRQFLIEGRSRLEGSLVLTQEIAMDRDFEKYFQDMDPIHSINPWLRYFWEARLNCYLDKSFQRMGKTGPCPDRVAQGYIQDTRISFHIQAVYALVKGYHAALTQHCGPLATRTCETLTSPKLVSAMREVELDLYGTGENSRVFDSNGDGLVGYNVLQVYRDPRSPEGDVIYREVGKWTTEGLDLDNELLTPVTSVCPNPVECQRCFPHSSDPTTSMTSKETTTTGAEAEGQKDSGFPVPGVAGLSAGMGIIIIVLIIIIVVVVCQSKRKRLLSGQHHQQQQQRQDTVHNRGGAAALRYQDSPALQRRHEAILRYDERAAHDVSGHYASPNEVAFLREPENHADPPHPSFTPPAPPPCPTRLRLDYLTVVAQSIAGSSGPTNSTHSSTSHGASGYTTSTSTANTSNPAVTESSLDLASGFSCVDLSQFDRGGH